MPAVYLPVITYSQPAQVQSAGTVGVCLVAANTDNGQDELTALGNPYYRRWWTSDQWLSDPLFVPAMFNFDGVPNLARATEWSRDYPGRLWLLLNEPERAEQGNTTPEDAALEAPFWLDGIDGTVAGFGTGIDAAGLDWLTAYLDAGGPVPDVWHVHWYQPWQLDAWQAWHAQHGQGKPWVLSEVGPATCAGCGQPMLTQVFDMVDRGIVLSAFWFGTVDPQWRTGTLANDDASLTDLGRAFVEYSQ